MSNEQDDLKAISEDLVVDAERVVEIETVKARLDVGDPRLPDLAAESERLVRAMVPKTVAERELVEETAGD